jgi:Leucine-rich repeat (LRR) protein
MAFFLVFLKGSRNFWTVRSDAFFFGLCENQKKMFALPAVLMRLIGEYAVDSVGALFTLLDVDTEWRRSLEHPVLVSHLRLRFSSGLLTWLGLFTPGIRCLDFPEQTTDADLDELGLLTSPCELDFSDCYFITGETLRVLPSVVHTLKFGCCRSLSDRGLLAIAHCTSLTHLQLFGCPRLSDQGLMALKNLRRLQSLDLGGCTKLSDDGVQDALAQLTLLQSLKLRHCHRITNLSFIAKLANLQSLDLSWCASVTDDSLTALAQLLHLRHLNLRGCYQLTNQGLTSLASLHLDVLNVSGCVNLTMTDVKLPPTVQELYASGCDRLLNLEPLHDLQVLRKLHLDDCVRLDSLRPLMSALSIQFMDLVGCVGIADLEPLASMHALTELRLTNCSAVTDLSPLQNLQHLRVLYVQGCNIQDDSLRALSKLVRLRELSLFGCSKITNQGLEGLRTLTRMCRLDLSGCNQLTDAGLQALAGMTRLQDLSLGDSPHIKHLEVLHHLPNLLDFKVCDCALDERALMQIGKLRRLKNLCLTGCKDFSDECLTHLQNLPLERLDLEAFDAITDAGLAALLKKLEGLHSVYIFNCKHITDVAMPVLGTIFTG